VELNVFAKIKILGMLKQCINKSRSHLQLMKSRAFFRKFPSSSLEIFPRKGEHFFLELLALLGENRLTRITKRRRGKSFYFDRDRGRLARGEL